MFLNSMFSQMTTGLKGDGPFGDTVGTGVWRSMLTEQYSQTIAKGGGVGIANDVFRTLILQQANSSTSTAKDDAMTQMQRQQAPAPVPPVASPADARKLANGLTEVMNALLALIERETELVRAGKIPRGDASSKREKNDLTKRYITAITLVKASQPYMAKATPDLLGALHRHHEVFRAMLQVNLTVLATAHAVSEGIVRGVNAEIQRRNIPQTYTACRPAQRARPAQPDADRRQPLAVGPEPSDRRFIADAAGPEAGGAFARAQFESNRSGVCRGSFRGSVHHVWRGSGLDLMEPGGCHEFRLHHQARGATGDTARRQAGA